MTVLKKVWPFNFRRRSVNHGQQHGDLRDKADDPQDQRVAKVLGQIGCEQGNVVFQAHKVRANDLQAAAVIFKKAVVNGGCQRDQLEYREDDEERRNEDVAPFRVADRPFLFLFSHKDRLLINLRKEQGRAGTASGPPLRIHFSVLGSAAIMRATPRRSAQDTSP